ncbi:glycosyltransferase family 4 protein [Sulfitobacter sp. MOLA879]|uniref:glycosyltransferase family 4 protein n=1 Tax=Sulfitobacter sp. MOLA879 TaxID=3368579 RepID=UPI003745A7A1
MTIKVLFSFGLGRLHFVQAVTSLIPHDVEVEVVQGVVLPKRLLAVFVRMIPPTSSIRGVFFGLSKRNLGMLAARMNRSLPAPEVLQFILLRLARAGLMSDDRARQIAWWCFGASSSLLVGNHDIVHIRAGAGSGILKEAKVRGIPRIVDFSIAHPAYLKRVLAPEFAKHGQPFNLDPGRGFWRMCLQDLEEADRILVNSEFVRSTMISEGICPEKLSVAYLGVRRDFLNLKRDYARGASLNLLFTGNFGLRKGAQYLIPALEQLVEKGMDLNLTVLGSVQESRELISRSSIADRITAPGFLPQDELKEYLAGSDIYVFPSLAEGCASSGMEAMAAGLPIVATEESGLPIVSGENGIIVESRSSEGIANAIHRLATDGECRRRLGTAASFDIRENYTWDEYARNVSAIYRTMSNSRTTKMLFSQ